MGARIVAWMEEGIDLLGDDDEEYWEKINVDIDGLRSMGDPSFARHFRLSKPTFEKLLETLANWMIDNGKVLRIRKRLDIPLLLVLWVLANPDTFRSVALHFGVLPGSLHDYYSTSIGCFRAMSPLYVKWPDAEERRVISAKFEAYSGFPGIVGVIDEVAQSLILEESARIRAREVAFEADALINNEVVAEEGAIHQPTSTNAESVIAGIKLPSVQLMGSSALIVLAGITLPLFALVSHNVITAPDEQANRYRNRYSSHSLNTQAVCDHNLLIRDFHVGEVGSMHDARVFRRSPLQRKLLENENNELLDADQHIIGDKAYPLMDCLMIPFKNLGNLTAEQRLYNRCLCKSRVRIEHAFGKAFGQWKRMKMLHTANLELAVDHIVSCFVLHNFMILNGEQLLDIAANDPTFHVDDYADPAEVDEENEDDIDEDGLNPNMHRMVLNAKLRGREKRVDFVRQLNLLYGAG